MFLCRNPASASNDEGQRLSQTEASFASSSRIAMFSAVEILDGITLAAPAALAARPRKIARPDRRLAVTARNVEHVGRLRQARQAPAQLAHQALAGLDRGAEMRGAGREIAMMQIIGLDPALDEGAHEAGEIGRASWRE